MIGAAVYCERRLQSFKQHDRGNIAAKCTATPGVRLDAPSANSADLGNNTTPFGANVQSEIIWDNLVPQFHEEREVTENVD
ncbi:hypothetical protein GCM10027562_43610 [Arthrobacter pigmenti]